MGLLKFQWAEKCDAFNLFVLRHFLVHTVGFEFGVFMRKFAYGRSLDLYSSREAACVCSMLIRVVVIRAMCSFAL